MILFLFFFFFAFYVFITNRHTHCRELRIYRAVAYRRQKKTYSYIAIDDLWTLALVCASAQSGWNTFNPEIGWHEAGSQCLLISFAHTNVATRHSTGVHERRTRSFEMRWQTDLYMPMIYAFIIRVVLTGVWCLLGNRWDIDSIDAAFAWPIHRFAQNDISECATLEQATTRRHWNQFWFGNCDFSVFEAETQTKCGTEK